MSDVDLEHKLRELALYGRSGCAVEPLLDGLWALAASQDAGQVMTLAGGQPK